MREAREKHLWSGLEQLRRVAESLREVDAKRSERAIEFRTEAATALEATLEDLTALLDREFEPTPNVMAAAVDDALFGERALLKVPDDDSVTAAELETFRRPAALVRHPSTRRWAAREVHSPSSSTTLSNGWTGPSS